MPIKSTYINHGCELLVSPFQSRFFYGLCSKTGFFLNDQKTLTPPDPTGNRRQSTRPVSITEPCNTGRVPSRVELATGNMIDHCPASINLTYYRWLSRTTALKFHIVDVDDQTSHSTPCCQCWNWKLSR